MKTTITMELEIDTNEFVNGTNEEGVLKWAKEFIKGENDFFGPVRIRVKGNVECEDTVYLD